MSTKQLSRASGLSLISCWKLSGKSRKEYCQEQNIPYHRLNYWAKIFNKEEERTGRLSNKRKFIAIEVKEEKIHEAGIEIKTPGGYTIKLFETVSLKAILDTIK